MRSALAIAAAAFFALGSVLAAQPAEAPDSAAEAPPTNPERTLQHEGRDFALANRCSSRNVETAEYTAGGEPLHNWTELVTLQRLSFPHASSPEALVAHFQKRLADEGAALDVLLQNEAASVFAVRFPSSERADEQVVICLAFGDSAERGRLHVVQYAIKPTRMAVDVATGRIRSWRDRFLTQARTLGAAQTAPQ